MPLTPFAFVLILAGVVFATPAASHVGLVSSDPGEGELLDAAPVEFTLTFNEPANPTVLQLIGPDGEAVDLADFDRRGNALVLAAPPMGEGTHILNWRVVGVDGHAEGGALLFAVGVVTGEGPAALSSDPLLRPLIWVTRVILYIGLLIGVAGSFFAAWIVSPAQFAQNGRVALRWIMIAGLASTPIAFALQGVDLLGGSVWSAFSPESWRASLESTYTATLIASVIALIAGLVGNAQAKNSKPLLPWELRPASWRELLISGAGLLAIGIAFSLSGHASSAPPQAVTWLVVLIHTITVAFWVGSLLPLTVVWHDPSCDSAAILSRFSTVIPYAIAALLVTGVLLIIVQLDSITELWSTDYGRILAVKMAAVMALLGLGVINRYRLTPAVRPTPAEPREAYAARQSRGAAPVLRRSIIVEVTVIFIVFGLVAGWRFTPPPRAAAVAMVVEEPFFTRFEGSDIAADITVSPGQIGPVSVSVVLYTAQLDPLTATELTVSLTNEEAGVGPIAKAAALAEDGTWLVEGLFLPIAGTWSLQLTALVSDFDRRFATVPVAIADPSVGENP